MLFNNCETLIKGKKKTVTGSIILILVCINAIILKFAFVRDGRLYYVLALTFPLFLATAIYYNNPKLFAFNRKPVTQGPLDDMVAK